MSQSELTSHLSDKSLIKEYVVGSKMLTGSLMLGGMILGIIMVFVEPSVSETENFAVSAQQLIDNSTQAHISFIGNTVAMLAALIGTAYLARSMQGADKPGSDLVGLASVVAFIAVTVLAVSGVLQDSILSTSFANSGGDAGTSYAISEGIGNGAFGFIGVTTLLLGIAIFRQKNLNPIVGAITGLFGALLIVGTVLPSADPGLDSTSTMEAIGGTAWFFGFLGWVLMTMVIGGITIKQARSS